MIVNPNRSNAYVGTFNFTDEDQNELSQIRKIVRNLNKDLKQFGYHYRYYVKLQGRGKERKNYQFSLPLSLAEKVDAYIYRR
jgi:hypothetical protein